MRRNLVVIIVTAGLALPAASAHAQSEELPWEKFGISVGWIHHAVGYQCATQFRDARHWCGH